MKKFGFFYLVFTVLSLETYSQYEFRNEAYKYPLFTKDASTLLTPIENITEAMLDSLIIAAMETHHFAGMQALIVKNDEIVWNKNYGFANIGLNKPVQDSTLFLVASISKTILVTAFMQLWEDGLFNLDHNINDYLQPDFQVINPSHPSDTITFRMIMTHTSSINDNWGILDPLTVCGDSPISLDSMLVNYFTPGGIYYSPSNFNSWAPGAEGEWDYSNIGSCILAYVVDLN